ncbi:hypothetical protein GCM10022212_13320 [Actimicrobium antarcticum]|uniref:Uncharacterized protein n=1 Tax=Actimicrobium antarcticum TaxID=1051899 RepID=A0ABP7SZ69_9BURK
MDRQKTTRIHGTRDEGEHSTKLQIGTPRAHGTGEITQKRDWHVDPG